MSDYLNCPNCQNVGWFVVANNYTGEPEQCQCEFCYTEPNSIFNVIANLNSQLTELREANRWKDEEIAKLTEQLKPLVERR